MLSRGHGIFRQSVAITALLAATPAWAAVPADDTPPAAATNDDADGTVTVTATRIPVAVQDAPVTVTVIDAQRIADELTTDIKDLIRYEPGISVTRQPSRFGAALGTTGRAGNEGFTIRGIGGNRVLIQVDGIRVPDGFTFGAQAVGRGDYVDVGLVKSVEILRGPASALYGSDGLAGAVSFTTSDPKDFLENGKTVGGLVRAAYSSADNEFSETAILAGRSGDLSAMVAYTRRDFNELDNAGTRDVIGATRTTPNPSDGRSNAALGRLVWEPGGGHTLRLTGEYTDNRLFTDVLSGRSATVDLLTGLDTGHRSRIGLDWSWQGDGTVEFARLAAWWQDAEDRQFTDEDRTPAADRERLNTFENRVYGAAGEVRLRFDTGSIAHRVVLGADASRTRQRGVRDGVVPPAGEVFPTRAFPSTDYTLAGLFIADQITLGPVTLHPALRFDAYDLSPENDPLLPAFTGAKQSGSRLSPKLGAVVTPVEGVRLFANYARGFKAPEPGQVNQFFENLAFGYTSRPNPNLRPETSESIEGGFRLFQGPVSLAVTGFHADYRGFISQEVVSGGFTPTNPAIYQFINLNRVKVDGAEGRLDLKDKSGLNGTLSLSWATGDVIGVTGARTPLSTIDPIKLVVGAGYDDPDRRFGARIIATHSARKELDRTTGVCPGATCFTADAFTILDLTAYARLTSGLTLRGGIFNVTDQRYAWWSDIRGLTTTSAVTDAYTQPGRNGSVSISYRF